MKRNDVQVLLNRKQKDALITLAGEKGLRVKRGGDGALEVVDGEEMLSPGPLGWSPCVRYNWKYMYETLRRQSEELQVMYDSIRSENRRLKQQMREVEGKTLYKCGQILSGRGSEGEVLRELKRYLGV